MPKLTDEIYADLVSWGMPEHPRTNARATIGLAPESEDARDLLTMHALRWFVSGGYRLPSITIEGTGDPAEPELIASIWQYRKHGNGMKACRTGIDDLDLLDAIVEATLAAKGEK